MATPSGEVIPSKEEKTLLTKDPTKCPQMYVAIYNIGKKKNIGSIVRSCVAFGVSKIFVVSRKRNEINFFGQMGTCKYITIEYFSNMKELRIHLANNNILLYACEITDRAIAVTRTPFVNKDTAFLFGNEGTGINDETLSYCDKIIYIPQYGNGTCSLNVSVSCAIILHHFAVWANYPEVEISGKKFVLNKCASKLEQYLNPSDDLLRQISEKRKERAEAKQISPDLADIHFVNPSFYHFPLLNSKEDAASMDTYNSPQMEEHPS
ncbi:RNA methyltransferase, putative [Plasmodium knowlesi strain H]|uniref:RNA methyltransferase, putative n=3 Tax=Plasmodium knowlesi TaxID=5850 RepID=A0A5K1U6M3_PLAKH|nr:RNA methyltransferase, putative [Plasmodium knowlesi strain H]OTN68209.1 putative RNA methyltransferase [Plasmodium knowlesi]CAA9987204.1 RNA methyltransferase, putative [Plasmodium knowlesi strain H]SBO23968.1 RNA methyltransferase, putative [Plasmodium knowlesi strain H]SBO25926.1 RNA methyltransferase, putative [Plasmodium knowlesi strain H]VVS76678.1 RNA methyltransferase, putative [Plasmodium knowlesi strain H]|eukprot:XP_002261825.1 SpoU rRNA Methylase, putative [Plasmodium knowlesi strain H]